MDRTALRILIVEDSEDDARLLLYALRRGPWEIIHERVDTREAMATALDKVAWDLIIADYSMPHFSGPEALALAKGRTPDLPFILVSGAVSEETAVQAMKAGANDYLSKGNFTRLVHVVERELLQAIDRRETRQVEQQLRKREAHLADALQLARVGTWHLDIGTGAAVWSDQACRILGVKPEEAAPNFQELLDRLREDDRAVLTELLQHPDTKQFSQDVRIMRVDGTKQYINIRGDIIRDSAAMPLEAAGTLQDISHRKHAEELLRASEAQYRTLFEYAPNGILIADSESYCLDANPSMRRMLGYTREELVGMHASCIVAESQCQLEVTPLKAVGSFSDEEQEWQFRRKNGSLFAAEVVATMMPDGHLVGMVRDITERKLAAEALAETSAETKRMNRELTFQQFALDQHAIVAITDRSGRIIYVNDKFCQISGYSRAELIGQDHQMLNSGFHLKQFFTQLYRTISQGMVWRGEMCNRSNEGRVYWVDTTIVPFLDEKGRVVRYVAIAVDITERKQVEKEIQRAHMQLTGQNQRLQALTEQAHRFVDDVSHEFRTPLAVIKEFAAIIGDGLAGPITPDQDRYLRIIDNAAVDLNQMVEDFLDSSKLRAGLLRVDRRLQSVESIFARIRPGLVKKAAGRNITIAERIDPELPMVFADEEKARRVVMNLATNAVKFSPEGSKIELWAVPSDDGGVEIGVTDTGRGMAPEDLKLLFERFRQLPNSNGPSVKGFGLGLNIARQLVWLNLGNIRVVSELNKGSTFSFTLPPGDNCVILDRFFARLAECVESAKSVAVISVTPENPEEPLDSLRQFLAATTRPTDVILTTICESSNSLLVLGPTESPQRWVSRLTQARCRAIADAGANAGNLRPLRITILGTFPYPEGADAAMHCAREHLLKESCFA